jgi:hypothetical protein
MSGDGLQLNVTIAVDVVLRLDDRGGTGFLSRLQVFSGPFSAGA